MNRSILLIISLISMLTACTRDFDPLRDSEQRNPVFRFETAKLLDNLLAIYPTHSAMGMENLDEGQRIRISLYCYDTTGRLVDKASTFVQQGVDPAITLRHLTRDIPYRFIFFGDIVEYENDVIFYERWYQLSYSQLDRFYIKILEWDIVDSKANALWFYDTIMAVENQSYHIPLRQITYNGFVCFTNSDDVQKLTLAVNRHNSLVISPFSGKDTDDRTIIISGPIPQQGCIGYTLPIVDADIPLNITMVTSGGLDTVSALVHNPERRPFTIFFDCVTRTIEQYDFY